MKDLHEEALERRHDAADEIRNLTQRWKERPTWEDCRLVERYAKHELHILVRFVVNGLTEEWIACFERLSPHRHLVGNGQRNDLPMGSDGWIPEHQITCFGATYPSRLTENSQQQAVLIGDVHAVQTVENVAEPVLIWFDAVNRFCRRWIRESLYLLVTQGWILHGRFRDREVDSSGRPGRHTARARLAEREGQMIECAPQVLDDIASNGCDFTWNDDIIC